MPKEKEKAVALSEFARQMGCTSKTIERYIQAGKIHGGAITQSAGGKNKVFPSLARPQYTAALEITAHRFTRANSLIDQGAPDYGSSTNLKKRKQKLTPEQDAELDSIFEAAGVPPLSKRPVSGSFPVESGPRRPQPQGGNLKTGKDRIESDITGTQSMSEDELLGLDINQLSKREAVLRVMRAQIEIGKSSGELLPIAKVEAALFSFGVEVRKRFEAMPPRIIDSLLNSKGRAVALGVFTKEVNSCLAGLSEAGSVLETIRNNRAK